MEHTCTTAPLRLEITLDGINIKGLDLEHLRILIRAMNELPWPTPNAQQDMRHLNDLKALFYKLGA